MNKNISIDLDIFQNANKMFDRRNIGCNLVKQKEELLKYSCFATSSSYQKSNFNKHYKNYDNSNKITKPNKLHIISANYTEKDQVKKNWIGYLNKLTEKNKEQYKEKINIFLNGLDDDIIKMELYLNVWDFIKRSPEPLYIDIVHMFDFSFTDKKWEKYIDKCEWFPSEVILNNNVLSSNENMYDIYCDFVSWKKHIKNINIGWCILFETKGLLSNLDKLLYSIIDLFELYKEKQKTHKHIIDFTLEQMLIIFSYYKNKDIVKTLYENNKNTTLQSSSKFLLMDIFDMCKPLEI